MSKTSRRRSLIRIGAYTLIALASATLGLLSQRLNFVEQLELRSYDYRFRLRGGLPQSAVVPITAVTVDERSLQQIPDPLMLWQRHFGVVLDGLLNAGAAAVGIDFVFSDISTIDADSAQQLNKTLIQHPAAEGPVVLAYRVRAQGVEQPPISLKMSADAGGHTFGFANLRADPDDFIRRQFIRGPSENGELQPSFALAVANAYAAKTGRSFTPPKADEILINYRQRGAFPRVSFSDVIDEIKRNDMASLRRQFEGNIVIIGMAAGPGGEDMHSTPHYYWSESPEDGLRTPGFEIQANTIATLLVGDAIREESYDRQAKLIFLIGIVMTIVWLKLSTTRAMAITAFAGAMYVFAALWFFNSGIWIWIVSPTITAALAVGLTQSSNYFFEGRERRRIHNLFGRYVSHQVIDELLHLPDGVVLTGERRRIAVLFADIRGFTTRSEVTSPETIVQLLNEYFADVIAIIQANGGTVNSLMGDGIMALFGAPLLDKDAAFHAVTAAREMMHAVRKFNDRLVARGMEPIQVGVGINAGEAVVGNMGSPQMMEYTAIGDVVNSASRIEGMTKQAGVDILISHAVYEWLDGRIPCETKGEVQVKGRSAAIPVYAVPWAE